jgi:flagellar P-ring protein FlgI
MTPEASRPFMFKTMKIGIIALAVSLAGLLPVQADRLKDLTSIAGVRSNQLVGYC